MTCSLVLILDHADMIMKRCKFDYHSEKKGQIAIDIGQGHIFISGKQILDNELSRKRAPGNLFLYSYHYHLVAMFMQSRLHTFLYTSPHK